MEKETRLTENESLLIIQQMIQTAKKEQRDDGKGWIIWGWMLFTASILTVINQQTQWFRPFFFWNLFGLLSVAIAVYEAFMAFVVKKKKKVKTYTQAIFDKLNVGFFVSLMFVIVAMNVGINPVRGFPLLMSLYGFWILIYGALLDFRPSILGAFIMWLLAFVALFVPFFMQGSVGGWTQQFSYIMVLHAAGVLCGYIIPGHIAYKQFKKVSVRNSTND